MQSRDARCTLPSVYATRFGSDNRVGAPLHDISNRISEAQSDVVDTAGPTGILAGVVQERGNRFVLSRAVLQRNAGDSKQMGQIRYSGAFPLLVRVNHGGVSERDLESRRQHHGSIVSANRWREKHVVIEAHHPPNAPRENGLNWRMVAQPQFAQGVEIGARNRLQRRGGEDVIEPSASENAIPLRVPAIFFAFITVQRSKYIGEIERCLLERLIANSKSSRR